jgi:endonuclease/exonuclease/phosphatase family metal-dependent hydrolase
MIAVLNSLNPSRVDAHTNLYLCVRLRWSRQTIDVYGIYSKARSKAFGHALARIKTSINEHSNYKFLVAGDFNEDYKRARAELKNLKCLTSKVEPTWFPTGNQAGQPSALDLLAARTKGDAQFKLSQDLVKELNSDHLALKGYIYFPPE